MWDDVRECPSTWTLAASWVLVFALMHLAQVDRPAAPPGGGSLISLVGVSTLTSHRFGDMTWTEIRQGEIWRALTATFVHYSLVHLGMNLIALIKLGRLIEPWYGPGPFLAVCLAIGGLGNLVGGLLRLGVGGLKSWVATSIIAKNWPALVDRLTGGPLAAPPISIHTGGGSTILLGLLGLAAVVGWRSRTRIGSFLRDQMVALLVFTAVLGVVMSQMIDNYGHAGGALVGAAIGFLHRPLIRAAERRPIRRLSWVTVGLLGLVCLTSAILDDRRDIRFERDLTAAAERSRADQQAIQDLDRLYILYGRRIARSEPLQPAAARLDFQAMADLFSRGLSVLPTTRDPANEREQVTLDGLELNQVLDRLDHHASVESSDVDRLRTLGRLAIEKVPRFDQAYEFVVCWNDAIKTLKIDLIQTQARLVELGQTHQGGR